MILIDANVLVYAYGSHFEQHARALDWLEEQLDGPRRVGLPWESLNAFVRLSTNPRIFAKPAGLTEAWEQVAAWLAAPTVWSPTPTDAHADLFAELLMTPGLKHDDVPDVHLAALARSHGLRLASHDRGFARFKRLEWFDPLDEG